MKLSEITNDKIKELTDAQKTAIVYGEIPQYGGHYDAGLILGTEPAGAKHRAEAAARFYFDGYVDFLIPSGGVLHAVGGKKISECDYMAEILKSLGVPDSAIILENSARNTKENFLCGILEICRRFELENIKGIAVITEPYHLRRGVALAGWLLPKNFNIGRYTEDFDKEKNGWVNDERLQTIVCNEIKYTKSLVDNGCIPDIEF